MDDENCMQSSKIYYCVIMSKKFLAQCSLSVVTFLFQIILFKEI